MKMAMAAMVMAAAVVVVDAQDGSDTLQLHGSGTSNPSKLIWKMMQTFEERIRTPTLMTYRSVGSGTGQKEFIGANNSYISYTDFGAGDIPFSNDDYQVTTAQGGAFMQIPFVLGAISFFFQIPGVATEQLYLTGCTLSAIFQRNITTWDHADILAAGSNSAIAGQLAGRPITVLRRIHGSSSTKSIAQYLHDVTIADTACPYKWVIGVGKGSADANNMPTSAPFWPTSTTGRETSDGIADGLAATDYSIGYIDSGHGHLLGLKEIELKNAANQYLSSRSATISAAADANPNLPLAHESWESMNLINRLGDTTWPITAMSYLYIRVNQTGTGQRGALLKAFATFALSSDGQAMAQESQFGFAPVSARLKAIGDAGLASMTLDPTVTEYVFETSTFKTPEGKGTGQFVVSSKRRQFSSYELDTHAASIAALQAAVTALQAASHAHEAEEESEVAATRLTQTRITALENQVNNITSNELDTHAASIAALQAAVTALQAASHAHEAEEDSEVAATRLTQTRITALENQVDDIKADDDDTDKTVHAALGLAIFSTVWALLLTAVVLFKNNNKIVEAKSAVSPS